MIDQRSLTELERLQARRRDALAAYNRTGDRAWMREAQEASQVIVDMLREMEAVDVLRPLVCFKSPQPG